MGYAANAQFHVELGLNFNSPQGDFADAYDLGIGGYIEPKYAMTENIDLGLYIGQNIFAGGDIAGTNTSLDAAKSLTILPTGTYRFSTSSITPYAGLGLGLYNFKTSAINANGTEDVTESKFGFAPRAGLYLGRLNLGAAYNIVSDANFIQFNLGVRILSRD
ncbi:MAG: hypothetical protein Tsb0034_07580 [Ekhidna sp.]